MPRQIISKWSFLILSSVVISALLKLAHIPAAVMLGAIFAGIVFSYKNMEGRIHPAVFRFSQGIIGCMIAARIPLNIVDELKSSWLFFIIGVLSAIIGAAFIGFIMAKKKILPGSTAIWGISPGGATAMTIMSEDFGADMRLVAFMQYMRVVFMTLLASLVSWLWIEDSGIPVPEIPWFPTINWYNFALTITLAACGAVLTGWFKIPAGSIMLPLIFGIFLQNTSGYKLELPYWLLAISYTIVGWNIGLRFTRQVIMYVYKVFPKVLLSIIALVMVCAVVAVLLVYFADIDPLTAYLATSPGGLDSVAIIAASSPVNMPFIMAMQTCRLILAVSLSPILARLISKRL
ncbi:MAG: AbrB family transcriptional regulator [Lactobacillaceae bacterium]|jgi:membrane AbrB-like protein|nr:AbrB family transcriptional regulator [Lactobacillaceae bacterium]